MIRLVRWSPLPLGFAAIIAGSVPAVHSQSGIPSLPRQERFTNRGDLAATLKVAPTALAPGQVPALTLVLENKGNRALSLSPEVSVDRNVRLSFYEASGERIEPTAACIIDRWTVLTSVRDLMVLKPAESTEFRLPGPCGGLPRMPTGKYRIQATYINVPDYPSTYDIYEQHGRQAWDGQIETPSIDVTVLPLNDDTERQLIAAVDGSGPDGVGAMYQLGLGRSAAAAASIVRRLERDHSALREAVVALADIGDPAAIADLGAVLERVPDSAPSTRSSPSFQVEMLIVSSTLERRTSRALVPPADGCAAISLRLLGMIGAATDSLLEQRCPDLRARLTSIRDTLPDALPSSDEHRRQTNRASRARAVLAHLERADSSEALPVARSYQDGDNESPDPRKLGGYLRKLLQGASWDDVEFRGLVKFATKDTYLQLRALLGEAKEDARPTISALIEVVTFHEPDTWQQSQNPRYWDSWWMTNRSLSRIAWAEQTLATWRLGEPGQFLREARTPAHAAEYLLAVHNNSPQVLARLAQHRSWLVRLAVADTVATYDRKRAGRLMIREFSSRYVQACKAADEALRELTRRDHSTECFNPTQRQAGIVYWSKTVDELQ